jgi:hypothetical protein
VTLQALRFCMLLHVARMLQTCFLASSSFLASCWFLMPSWIQTVSAAWSLIPGMSMIGTTCVPSRVQGHITTL